MMTPTLMISVVSTFGLSMLAVSLVRRYSSGLELFLVAGRSVGIWYGAMSVAATWIWAPALFISAQKSYQQGLPGIMWFLAPNVGCLIFFAFLADRIRKVFPRGYTFPEYIGIRYDSRTQAIYLFSFLSLQVCSVAVQLIAGAAMLESMSGIPYAAGVLILAAIFVSYSLIDGLESSMRTDVLQLLLIYVGIGVLVPLCVSRGGGLDAVHAGLAGFSGKFGSLLDPFVAYSFGITVTIGLMSGPVGDQMHWQRVFAFEEGKAKKAYFLAAALFGVVPLSLSVLGFLAAGAPATVPHVTSGAVSAQQVAPEVVASLIPGWGVVVFAVVVLAGLTSTGDSALCAAASLVAVDIYRKRLRPEATDEEALLVSRFAVAGTALVAIAIAFVPGVTILGLFLFYGTLRSSTLMPTIVTIYMDNVPSWGVFWGVALAILLGLPAYVWGELSGDINLKVAANIGILFVSLLLPVTGAILERRRSHEVSQL